LVRFPGAIAATIKQHVNPLENKATIFSRNIKNPFHAEDIPALVA
jgi:hypothetical protein